MNILKRNLKVCSIFVFLFLLSTFSQIAFTQEKVDFNVTSSYNIYLKNISDDFVTVEEQIEIQAYNTSYYIPSGSNQIITIKKDDLAKETIQVLNKYGRPQAYTINEEDDILQVIIKNETEIKTNNPFSVKVTYKTREYINQNGNITNLYLPGLQENITFEDTDPVHNLKTKHQYFLSYHVPKNSPEHSFISPKSILFTEEGEYRVYTFPQNARIGTTGWIQLGSKQFYFFKIVQEIPQTDFLTPASISKYTGWLSTNILELTLPREFHENNQEVFFTQISPQPSKIKSDQEGNVIAVFEIDANKDQQVVIEGYIKLSKKILEIPNFTISQYKEKTTALDRLGIYIQPDTYWESDNPMIQEVAKKLLDENKDLPVLDLIKANYSFVIENLEYSTQKAESENIRVGALKALQGYEAVCMEYADLLIAISRAQGIPARAAFGYGNDPLLENLEKQIGHQWVQIWYPEYGWLSVDPTWGETGREYIGGDLDHLLWHTSGDSQEKTSESVIYSADFVTTQTLDNYTAIITALHENEVPDLSESHSISETVLQYKDQQDSSTSDIEYLLKTTVLGRALIFIIPIITILITITIISVVISKLLKKKKTAVYI